MSLRMSVAIVGAAETDAVGVLPDRSAIQLHAEAAFNALADAGLTKDDIDGVLTAGQSPVAVAEYLGIVPTYVDGTSVGGCSFMLHVRHAAAAIQAGLCTTALITHGQSGRSRVGETRWGGGGQGNGGQFEEPYGVAGPPTRFTIPILRHMHEYGTTPEQMASVAVATRRWAEKNPRAMMRDPITVDDVLASRVIAYPVHLLECCLVTDGGGAVIVVSAERAKDFPKKPVYLLGIGRVDRALDDQPDGRLHGVARLQDLRRVGVQRGQASTARTSTTRCSTTPSPTRRCTRSKAWASSARVRAGPSSGDAHGARRRLSAQHEWRRA